MFAGIADMKPTSFLLLLTRTPQCHSAIHPGGLSALEIHLFANQSCFYRNEHLKFDQLIDYHRKNSAE